MDINEILRYMGCPPEQAAPQTRTLAEQAAVQMEQTARPRSVFRESGLSITGDGVLLESGLLLPGRDLAQHLAGCDRAVMLAVTLSAQADTLIRRAESRDMAQALALDCAAAALVEEVCDRLEADIFTKYPGCYFPFRFSPGYGDLPLSVQSGLLTLLDAPRKIGLCANENHILTPRKSVTALIGISREPVDRAVRSCQSCPGREGCQYRKSGGHCGAS